MMNFTKNTFCRFCSFLGAVISLGACAENALTSSVYKATLSVTEKKKTLSKALPVSEKDTVYYPDFVSIKTLSVDILLDIKYATNDNFLQQEVYDCAECFLRRETAMALIEAQKEFLQLGYRLKLFDCYRPLSVQRKMWKIMPGTHYVANPAKGSKHNRGAAVDLTLVNMEGEELDMGTPFDFFGQKAHHSYQNLPAEVLKNRMLLKTVMDKHNFKSIFSEWWHYEYRPQRNAPVEDFTWDCHSATP